MESKPFRTIQQQIEILKDRGLIINDKIYANRVLSHINYYRLSGYTLTLRKNNEFNNNITLEQVIQIYNFDSELRADLLYLLEHIEISFRTHFGYFHSEKYGPLGYLSKEAFLENGHYKKFNDIITQLIKENEKNEVFIKHHKEKYDGYFPSWVIVELMSFGCLSRGFKNLHNEVKESICKQHYSPIPYEYIENWLQGFVILRNICAHRGRLYNRYIAFSLRLSKKDKNIFKDYDLDLNKQTKQLFTYIYVMNKLVDDTQVKLNFSNRINTLIKKYPFVKLQYYGFPKDWRNILNINE
ncbi:MAG: Abi family protein [Clostridium sp.]